MVEASPFILAHELGENQGLFGAMGVSPIFRPIVGRNDVIAHPFAPDGGRKLWANASKQNGVIKNLNFTIDPVKSTYFRHQHMDLVCFKHDVYYS